MNKVLVDTSSLLHLAKYSDNNFQWRLNDILCDYNARNAAETTFESLILYDNIYVDTQSYVFNEQHYECLKHLDPYLNKICLDEEEEVELLDVVKNKFKSLLSIEIPEQEVNLLAYFYPETTERDSFGHSYTFPIQLFNSKQTYEVMLDIIKDIFGEVEESAYALSEMQNYMLVFRHLYYLELQHYISADLVLHPDKQNRMKKLGQYLINNQFLGTGLLNKFDETRQQHIDRLKKEYLNLPDYSVPIPIMSNYILSRCKTPEDLIHIILETRHSKKAISFREGISELTNALKNNDRKLIDETLYELERANEEWEKSLTHNPMRKRISISVSLPFAPVGTTFDLPIPRANKTTATKLLVFIHKLMKENYK